MRETTNSGCEAAQQLLHQVLDADLMDAQDQQQLAAHLAICSACRQTSVQLEQLQDLLRAGCETPLPEAALERVWDRTVRASASGHGRVKRFDWRFAAAAATIVAAAWIGVRFYPRPAPELVDLRGKQAAEEVRMVMQLAANALKRTEDVAFREIFTEEVFPALRKVGIRWPQAPVSGAPEKEVEL